MSIASCIAENPANVSLASLYSWLLSRATKNFFLVPIILLTWVGPIEVSLPLSGLFALEIKSSIASFK